MCTKAGLQGDYTNHSGKRTCATSLFQNNIDEQMIKERTGHRSDAVGAYKVPSNIMKRDISNILEPENAENSEQKAKKPRDFFTAGTAGATFNNCTFNF